MQSRRIYSLDPIEMKSDITRQIENDYEGQTVGRMISNVPVFEHCRDQIITAKGYQNYFGVSYSTAKKYLTTDRKKLGLDPDDKFRMSHFITIYGSPLFY